MRLTTLTIFLVLTLGVCHVPTAAAEDFTPGGVGSGPVWSTAVQDAALLRSVPSGAIARVRRRHHLRRKSPVRSFESKPRHTTVTLPSGAAEKVSNTTSATPVLTLVPGAKPPPVGHGLVVMPSSSVPTGMVGVVTGTSQAGDHTTVQLRKAALSEVFSTYNVVASGTVDEATGASVAGLTTGHVASSAGALDPHFSCSGSAPTPHITVDLSQLNYSLNVKIPHYIRASLTGPIKFSVGVNFTAAASCTASLTTRIPIGGTGLFIEIGPEFTIQAGGAVSANFTWTPQLTYAFYRSFDGVGDYDKHQLTTSSSINFAGAATISTNLGLQVGLEAFGSAGVKGTLGPKLSARLENTGGKSCRIIEGAAEADLTAYAHVWFTTWTFNLANLVFWQHEFASMCSPVSGGGGSGGGSAGSGGAVGGGGGGGGGSGGGSSVAVTNPGNQTTTVGSPASLQVHASDSNGYALTYTASGLPHGLTINPSTGLISGTPEDIGESAVTIQAEDTSGESGSTSFAWTISSPPGQSTWTIEQLAKPSGAQSVALSDVSCTATTACMGVGYSETFPEAKPLAEFWNGSSWTVQPVPSPPGERNVLTSVSCTSTISCVAIGGGNGSPVPFSETWNGATWTMQGTPTPAESQVTNLTSVSCLSSVSCIAVGNYTDEISSSKALAEYWNGSIWTLQSAIDPIPPGSPNDDSDSELKSIDCTGPKACVAVGQSENQPEDKWPTLAESWNGTGWTIQSTPVTGAYEMQFESISCSEPSACTAVGSSEGETLAERWNGAEWTVQSSANPPREFSDLGSVSCASATSCLAVGVGGSPDAFYSSFWDGTTWTTEEIPGLGDGGIDAVFCVTPTYCMGVGSDTALYF
jgi:uncharacterized membrane protein YgcG